MTVTQLTSFDPSGLAGTLNTSQKQYKLLVYNWSQYSLTFKFTSGNVWLVPAKARRRIYLDEPDGKIVWAATSVLSSGVNLVQMEIFLPGDCLPYDDLEDLSSVAPPAPSNNFWQGDGQPGVCIAGTGSLVILNVNTSGGTATINVNGCGSNYCSGMSLGKFLEVGIDGNYSPPALSVNINPNFQSSGCGNGSVTVPLAAGFHTIELRFHGGSCLFGCENVDSSHIDVTVV